MKKTISNISLVLLALLTMSSCSDFLDQPVLGKENLETYFQTEDECLKEITGCYQSIFWDGWWQVQKFVLASDMCTDDMWMGNTTQDAGEYRDLAHYTGNSLTDATQNFWQYRYKGILRSNICIERISNSPIKNEELKNRMVTEAKFLRAFHYFDLARNFGGLPIVLGMKLPSEVAGIQRASIEDTYKQIEKDLQEAIPYLPLRSEYDEKDLGRVTKGAAEGFLAKVYLYQEKYPEAEEMLSDLINSNEYKLLANFGDVWSVSHNNSEESIFEVQFMFDDTYALGGSIPVICGSRDDSGWSWGLPTSNLEKAFLDAGDSERLKWTIIKHDATSVPGDPAWNADKPYIITPDKHKSARISRKNYIPVKERPAVYNIDKLPLNYRLLRYADVLLMQAEVKNALGKDGEAREALNLVRERVGLPKIMTATGTTLRDAIRLERRLELALENQRLYDIRRWKDDNGKKHVANLMGAKGSFVIYNTEESTDVYELTNQKERSDKGITFKEDRDLLFPIPNSEVTMSDGSIKQNPNY